MGFSIHHRINLIDALLIFSSFFLGFGSANSTIESGQFIRDPETLTGSNHSVFTLGFFTPRNSTNRYVGIWYINESYVYWVANRNQPLKDSSGSVTIADDGNLVILNGQNQVIWTTNVSKITGNTTAQLQDSGNLVLLGDSTGETIWESFKHPGHAAVPRMRISQNRFTGEKIQFTSWKSPSDPSVGYFSGSLERLNAPEVFFFNGSRPLWRTGPWNGRIFIGATEMSTGYLYGWVLGNDPDGTVYLTYSFSSPSSSGMLALNPQGKLDLWRFVNNEETFRYTFQRTECDDYGLCGPYGSCNQQSSPICSCLDGYEPKNLEEWNNKNWTSGCVRKTPLQCERQRNGSVNVEPDGFLRLPTMKVPDFAERLDVEEDKCRPECLQNCSCVAYAYDAGIGCMYWTGDLLDLRQFSSGGADLFLRLASSELKIYTEKRKRKDNKLVIGISVAIGTIALAACVYLLRKLTSKRKGKEKTEIQSQRITGHQKQVKLEELPLFDFIKLATATNDFHSANMLGKGGFGPVYKGELEDGQEIAVKRLSRASGQGVEEFMNEVLVISKLQHRNLVRLLGCCIERDEKMLIYEFMSNKSLDAFLFDPVRRTSLDWKKRFNIIEGIARGLLYLHRDSRLKIIHRDLKVSNILLDGEMNPKISDFGMARIFGSNEDEANTRRVVGTYGYMAPEYAMKGLFSEKSDVYSFGVLLLEIVTGRRNNSFYNNEQSHSLLGLAWKLWKEENIMPLIDPEISDSCSESNILRCVHIGLLCVQEHAKERPSMSTVVSMLASEIVNLPPPRQVALVLRHNLSSSESSSRENKYYSTNNVTITEIQGR